MPRRRPLVAIVGQTATGKTEAAVAVALAAGGEVVGADAFQVYRGMDIGTAKPSPAQRRLVPHHLVDVLEPDEELSLARYLDLARAALEDIWARHKVPIVCGGSGQYVWALLEGWEVPRVAPDRELREALERFAAEHGAEALHARLAQADPDAAARIDYRNVRRVVRALEVIERDGRPLSACRARHPVDAEVLVLGLRCPRADLHARIDRRVEEMYAAGLVQEVERLRAAGYGEARPVRSGIGYREAGLYLDGVISLEEAIARTKIATHRLARNQAAWFKESDPRIHWLDAGGGAADRCVSMTLEWLEG
ncbi:MAG TPA: tRNA (adenosine(37)-N6)-dimethylallyltransferase MiaA [Dehalococcoidia bacterium]|nr:tRNA (adenosine(37)-N6)-dimethylallyltransferase MiaA [Dehalococcoidia bacterium]